MVRDSLMVLVFVPLLAVSLVPPAQHKPAGDAYVPVTSYDPQRDAGKDIVEAIAEAKRTGRRVLLEVGGDWCIWCHTMDKFFADNAALLELRERNFVTVKINMSKENENQAVLSRYPEISGYPHLFVLDETGELLESKNTGELESGKSYDLDRFVEFLKKWAKGS
jgi:thiol:disulfide interchange protein